MLAGYGEVGALRHRWGECTKAQLLWKIMWWFLKKFDVHLTYVSVILLFAQKKLKDVNTCIPISIEALFIIAKNPGDNLNAL